MSNTLDQIIEFKKETRLASYTDKIKISKNIDGDVDIKINHHIEYVYLGDFKISSDAVYTIIDRELWIVTYTKDLIKLDLSDQYICITEKSSTELQFEVKKFDKDVIASKNEDIYSYPIYDISMIQNADLSYESTITAKFSLYDITNLIVARLHEDDIYKISTETATMVNKFRKSNISSLLQYEDFYIIYKSDVYMSIELEDEFIYVEKLTGLGDTNTKVFLQLQYIDILEDLHVFNNKSIITVNDISVIDYEAKRAVPYINKDLFKLLELYNLISIDHGIYNNSITSSMIDLYKVFNIIYDINIQKLNNLFDNDGEVVCLINNKYNIFNRTLFYSMKSNLEDIMSN